MRNLNRRDFLKGGSMAVVAAGVVSAMPVMPALVSAAETEGPAAETVATQAEALSMAEPLVARVNDLTTGAMSLFVGSNEITYNDPQLAARLFRAAQ